MLYAICDPCVWVCMFGEMAGGGGLGNGGGDGGGGAAVLVVGSAALFRGFGLTGDDGGHTFSRAESTTENSLASRSIIIEN